MLKVLRVSVFMFLMGLFSCGNTTGNFWKNYKKELLVENVSEQGGWGGHRALHWSGSFSEEEVLNYAKEHDWNFVEEIEVKESELNSWEYMNQPIFPLSHEGFELKPSSSSNTFQHFPRWIKTSLKVYSFKTGMLAIKPGTDEAMEVNGFVVLSKDNKELSVYHLWGE
tara:strand:- start:4865 stop:5368 length:504 start_codon:yes stop_codon:yes gene_type:complete